MSSRNISTLEEALALANVINPAGQRFNIDGDIVPGLPGHETNCALVALATAAFLQDGTEVAAFSAPSRLMAYAKKTQLHYIASEGTLKDEQPPKIDCTKKEDQQIINEVKEICKSYPGQSAMILGNYGQGHHWFNIPADGTVIDIQCGLKGDELLLGQQTKGGVWAFNEIEIYPVDLDLSGKQIIAGTEAQHNLNALWSLASRVGLKVDLGIVWLSPIIEQTARPYIEEQSKLGHNYEPELVGEKIADILNAMLDSIITELDGQGKDGRKEVVKALSEILSEEKDNRSYWYSESDFRKPSTTEETQQVLEKYAFQCPVLYDAIQVNKSLHNDLGH